MATMKDVAKAAGVSTATVSASLSGASFVSPILQARVAKAIEVLGYERNSMASGLKRGKTALIGLIVSDITNPFFTELVHCVQKKAWQAGYSVLLGISDHDSGREAELLRLMRSHQAEGTILCPAGGIEDYQPHCLKIGRMKLVAVDNAAPDMPFDTIALDNHKAAGLAVRHILSFGHRRVAAMAGHAHQLVSRQRLDGFRDAMVAENVAVDPARIRHGDFRIEDAYRSCGELLSLQLRPTALFVANNLMLIGVMRALAEAGIAVPGDMSVASIDDFPWASAFQPALTVVRQPIADMATLAFDRLIERMKGDDSPRSHTLCDPQLIIRQSCAPPRVAE